MVSTAVWLRVLAKERSQKVVSPPNSGGWPTPVSSALLLKRAALYVGAASHRLVPTILKGTMTSSLLKTLPEGVSLNPSRGVVTSFHPEYYNPEVHAPPRGVDLWVITRGGVSLKSVWRDGYGFVAWCPMPKTPMWLKDKLNSLYKTQHNCTGESCNG